MGSKGRWDPATFPCSKVCAPAGLAAALEGSWVLAAGRVSKRQGFLGFLEGAFRPQPTSSGRAPGHEDLSSLHQACLRPSKAHRVGLRSGAFLGSGALVNLWALLQN